MNKLAIFTIGHSTHSIEEFVDLLQSQGITEVVDVRSIPKSRHNPQFNSDTLAESLRKVHIHYKHLKELGGLRHSKKDSINLGWHNTSFRGFADYMGTPEFAKGLGDLEKIATQRKTAIMCAEAVPWRCHRSLIADALTKQKWDVFDIINLKTASKHRLTPFLKVKKGQLVYPELVEEENNLGMIKIKRVYEKSTKDDGIRILVDRLWPRGLTKEKARVDIWLKDIGPSTELRKWFGHDPKHWSGFKTKYKQELKTKKDLLKEIKEQFKKGSVTLLYGARDTEHNEALVLKEYLKL